MSTLLWPELAREKAGSYSRVAASLEEELRQIEDLRSKEDGREALKRRAARGARWAMADTLRSEAEILDFWRSTLDIFKEGVGDVPSNEMLQNVRDIIENWLRLARNSREMLRLAAALGHPPEGLEELSAAEVEVGQVKAAAENMTAFLTRPRPSTDVALLEKGWDEIAQGRYRTAEQIRAGRRPAEGGTE